MIYDPQLQSTLVLRLQLQRHKACNKYFPVLLRITRSLSSAERGHGTRRFHGDLRNTATQIAAICSSEIRISTPKQKNDDFEALFTRNLKGKSAVPKWKKSAAKAPFATFMQPLQYDLRLLAARHNSVGS